MQEVAISYSEFRQLDEWVGTELLGDISLAGEKHSVLSEELGRFIQVLYGDSTGKNKGYVCTSGMSSDGTMQKEEYQSYGTFLASRSLQVGAVDRFMVVNTFKLQKGIETRRTAEYLYQLRGFYIDLDVEKYEKYSMSETLDKIWQLVDDGQIPKPNIIVNSTGGFHLYFLFRDANPNKSTLDIWHKVENVLYNKLKHLGADKQVTDITRFLRVPCTINSKRDRMCRVEYISHEPKWQLLQYKEFFIQDIKKPVKKKPTQKLVTKASTELKVQGEVMTGYTLHRARLEDIETLLHLRQGNVDGIRNVMLLYYLYLNGVTTNLKVDSELVEQWAEEFQRKLSNPLTSSEVRKAVKMALKYINKYLGYIEALRQDYSVKAVAGATDKKGLWYTRESLVDLFSITDREASSLNSMITETEYKIRNNISSKKYYEKNKAEILEKKKQERRDEEGLTNREKKKKDTYESIQSLKLQGLTQKQVAESIGVGIATVKRHWK